MKDLQSHFLDLNSLSLTLVLVLSTNIALCQSGTPSAAAPQTVAPLAIKTGTAFQLGPGDLLDISVYGVPELSQKVRVSNNGEIYLALVDYLKVTGLTPEEAQIEIQKKLSEGGFVRNPHVSVLVAESATATVSVLGEVWRPGVVPLRGTSRLYDILSAAGSLTDKAGRNVAITHRADPEHPVTVTMPPDISQDSAANIPISAGDTVVVSRGEVFYVIGDVVRPAGFIMDGGSLGVLKAVVLAGGPNRSASLNSVSILRKTPQGVQQIQVPMRKIMAAKSPDIPMQADDILYVPTGGNKLLGSRALEAVFQTATAASLIAIRP